MNATATRVLVPVALVVAGAWIALPARVPVYGFSWSHPAVMLVGQFALLAAAAVCARHRVLGPVAMGAFWVFSGATLGPLLARSASTLGGAAAAAGATALAVALALLAFAYLRR